MKSVLLSLMLPVALNASIRVPNGNNLPNDSILHQAVVIRESGAILKFIEGGADVNSRDNNGDTPLCLAIKNDNFEAVRLLIQKGADVNITNQSSDTPLHLAVAEGSYEMVRMLVKNGANVDVKNQNGNAPLHLAVKGGVLGVIDLLIKKGANIDVQDSKGRTPLYLAAKKGKLDIVVLLIQNKADANVMDNNGKGPGHQNGHKPYDVAEDKASRKKGKEKRIYNNIVDELIRETENPGGMESLEQDLED